MEVQHSIYSNIDMFSLYYIELVQCPEVNDPTNGNASIEHRVRGVGDIVEYTCSSGYDLVGSSSRTCLPDGTWTENTPQCSCIRCKYIMRIFQVGREL